MAVQQLVHCERFPVVNDAGGGGGGGSGLGTAGLRKVGCTRLLVAGSLRGTAVGLMTLRMVIGPTVSSSPTYRDVLSGESHALSNPVDGGWYSFPVCLLPNSGQCSDEVSVCDSPCPLTASDECLCRRNPDLLLLTGK